MEDKGKQFMAGILQSIDTALQGENVTPEEMEASKDFISKEWEGFMNSVGEVPEYEPPGKLNLVLFLMPLDAAASPLRSHGPRKKG
jgi:hypothetical protein